MNSKAPPPTQFLNRELVGRPAKFAGDEAMKTRKRVFGVVRFDESFAGLDQAGALFVKQLRRQGVPLGAEVPYKLDLAKAQENAKLPRPLFSLGVFRRLGGSLLLVEL